LKSNLKHELLKSLQQMKHLLMGAIGLGGLLFKFDSNLGAPIC
jgi:hypothetical protein